MYIAIGVTKYDTMQIRPSIPITAQRGPTKNLVTKIQSQVEKGTKKGLMHLFSHCVSLDVEFPNPGSCWTVSPLPMCFVSQNKFRTFDMFLRP